MLSGRLIKYFKSSLNTKILREAFIEKQKKKLPTNEDLSNCQNWGGKKHGGVNSFTYVGSILSKTGGADKDIKKEMKKQGMPLLLSDQ